MMATLLSSTVLWTGAFILLGPLIIIGAGEIEERLRYRDSALIPAMSIFRTWVLPLGAITLVGAGFLGFDSFLVRVVGTAAVFAVAAALVAVLGVFVNALKARGAEDSRKHVPRLLLAVPRILVIFVTAWMLVSGVWSIDVSSLFAALGVSTLIVSLALQDTLSGMASGFLLMLDRPFQPGDWINAESIEGRVVDTNWRSSRIQNRDGDLVVVPNAQLAGVTITNFDEPARLHRVKVSVQVAFANPPNVAIAMLLDAARSTPGVLSDPSPDIVVAQVDDPLMGYEAHLWIDDYAIAIQVASDFRALVWYNSERQSVPLPSPAFDLYTYDGVKNAQAKVPTLTDIRRSLLQSPLFSEIEDDDLDRLAAASQSVPFGAGEVMVEPGRAQPPLFTIREGTGRLEIVGADGQVREIAVVESGDVFGLVTRSREWNAQPRVVAVSDCEVIVTDIEAAGSVISKNQNLADALNQVGTRRIRMIDRLLARESPPPVEEADRTDDESSQS